MPSANFANMLFGVPKDIQWPMLIVEDLFYYWINCEPSKKNGYLDAIIINMYK